MDRVSPEVAAKTLELMADPAALDTLRRSGLDLSRFGQKRSNAELMRSHEKLLADMRRARATGMVTFRIGTTNAMVDVKPAHAFASPRVASDLTPIHASALAVGVTHRGRALRGTIVGAPFVMTAAQLLLEDDCGDYVKLSVYNRVRSQAEADALFVVGRRLLVLEPFYKVMGDGTRGIRCDNPNEVIVLPADDGTLGGTSSAVARAEACKVEGNRHFAAVEFEEAVASYTSGLDELDSRGASGRLLALCYLNSSAYLLELGEPMRALEAANVALALLAVAEHAPPRPELGKALVRAGRAAAALSASSAARWAMLEAARITRADDGGAKLLALIGERPAATSSGGDGLGLLLRALHAGDGSAHARERPGAEPALHAIGASAAPERRGGAHCLLGAGAARTPMRSTELASARTAETKARGNALFVAGDFSGALACYEAAVRELGCASLAATLLANRAAAFLRIGTQPALLGALRDARAALAIDRNEQQPKARHRVVLALVALEWLSEAEAACDEALRALPSGEHARVFAELGARIAERRSSVASAASEQPRRARSSEPRPSVRGRLNEVLRAQGELPDTASAMCMENARMMLSMAMRAGGDDAKMRESLLFEGPLYDERVAPFHKEFSQAGLMPKQCDVKRCMTKLHSAYEHAVAIRMHELQMTSGPSSTRRNDSGPDALAFGDSCFVTVGDVLKRLRSNEPADIDWLLHAKHGSVREIGARPYEKELHHSFSNAPVTPTVMAAGRTHVAVGFVDLASLSASIKISGYGEASSAPTRWVGYEQSAYAVAKTAAIIAMMQRGASDDDVLQVWFSAAWSVGARASFRTALRDMLSPECPRVTGGLDGGAVPPTVLAFLRHWSLADVPLAAARTGWLDSWEGSCVSFIGNFRLARDRHALCAYMLCGQLLAAQVGSVVMFGMPDELGAVSPSESFLQTISFVELVNAPSSAVCDVIETCVRIVRGRIADLSREMRRGAIGVRLRLATLAPDSHALHAEIRSLQPHTLNWSNVPDYLPPAMFHAIARACSAAKDTVHVMYTMNWPIFPHGASHVEYAARCEPQKIKELFRGMVTGAHGAIAAQYGLLGWDKVMLVPPNSNIRDILDFGCMMSTHREWAAAFLARGGFAHSHQTMHSMPTFSVLHRADSTFALAFSYDPSVRVK